MSAEAPPVRATLITKGGDRVTSMLAALQANATFPREHSATPPLSTLPRHTRTPRTATPEQDRP